MGGGRGPLPSLRLSLECCRQLLLLLVLCAAVLARGQRVKHEVFNCLEHEVSQCRFYGVTHCCCYPVLFLLLTRGT